MIIAIIMMMKLFPQHQHLPAFGFEFDLAAAAFGGAFGGGYGDVDGGAGRRQLDVRVLCC